ncbi:MAG TPA: EF-P lysine aminoacylase EpmA [Steroidobacteraceae bacterium]|nr:EF-P lysine aminoacylase EpmA [Steroidobacteraceae bacterium]
MSHSDDWQPSATRTRLSERAALLRRAREFFAARSVLEVDTPMVVNAPVSDVHIHSATVDLAGEPRSRQRAPAAPLYLHTSPEYAMKRLLAAGSGDIFQICHVVRGNERGRLHNPEFTLIEWYRIGFSLGELMDEVDALVRTLLGAAAPGASEQISYREAFLRELGLDPLTASTGELAQAAAPLGFRDPDGALDRDGWLELLMSGRVGPRLGRERLTFVNSYPASQAALAQLDPADARVAQRFELYGQGIELGNGFHELAAEPEQRARFVRDNEERRRRGLPVAALDERLLAALAAGLPGCCGVALGFDRIVMGATGATHIDEVLSFPTGRA